MEFDEIKFLCTVVPKSAENIKEALELLLESVGDAKDEVGNKLKTFYENNDFEKATDLIKNSKSFYTLTQQLQEIINQFDTQLMTVSDDIALAQESHDDIDDIDIDNINIEDIDIPDYEQYLVNTNLEHNLYEDYTYKRPYAIRIEDKKILVNEWKSALLETISYLYDKNPTIIKSFIGNSNMNGKKVNYFSDSVNKNMRSPRRIKDSNIYVETNLSANSIRNLLCKVLKRYNIQLDNYKIYLRADYSKLH